MMAEIMRPRNIFLLFFILNFLAGTAASQDTTNPGFNRDFSVPAVDEGGANRYAWAGGLNSCQFGEVDLDLDNTMDLVVFDRSGNRILPFINNGAPDSSDYDYSPEYVKNFPALHDWAIFRDYDADGKQDIFSYSVGGMAVYRNVSDTVLKFKMMVLLLNSYYYVNYINIYVTDVDFPGIEDIDGDGDLDILNFFGLGVYVEYHKNLSMEKYGVPDSLDYMLTEKCWGYFGESAYDNKLLLNLPCPLKDCEGDGPAVPVAGRNIEHTGSTFLLLDVNGDSLQDLVLGDVDYTSLKLLVNGGASDSAHMVSQDTLFPTASHPIDLFSFPVASYLDIDNDGVKELMVSPFDPSPIIPENFRSVWYYENTGSTAQPQFIFKKPDFFQDEMIETGAGAYPVFFDYNNDGLLDLVVANYGYWDSSYFYQGFLYSIFRSKLALFENTGSASSPAYTLITRDFASAGSRKLVSVYPAFGDIDGDGDKDMILGKQDGSVDLYRNIATAGNPAQFSLETINYQGIDAGDYATPQLVDLDQDGPLDLVMGNKIGTLTYYRNAGSSTNPDFQWVTDSLGKVDVRDVTFSYTGYSVPCFYHNFNDSLALMVGSLRGFIAYYRNIIHHLADSFELADINYLFIDEGEKSAPALADLNNDSFPEMIIGNYGGGLAFYLGEKETGTGWDEISRQDEMQMLIYPNPSTGIVNLLFSRNINAANAVYTVTDFTGRIVRNGILQAGNRALLDLSDLPAGLYLIQAEAKGAGKESMRVAGKVIIR